MLKRKLLCLVLATSVILGLNSTSTYARDYDYNIYATATDSGYTTSEQFRTCGSYSLEYATNRLNTNTSTHQIYFRVGYVDGWIDATPYRWQSSGTTLFYDYYNPSFTDKTGYYKLFMRRDTDDTYSGTRNVAGSWFVE